MAVKSQSQNRQLFIVCQNGEDGKQVKYKIEKKKENHRGGDRLLRTVELL